jgi:diketogulonate reductase-like aldo/keto reductase
MGRLGMIQMASVTANGAKIPVIGLGTWELSGDTCVKAVEAALACGYRHIDTARMYGNEVEVGEGLRAGGLPRDDVFVTTKVWYDDLAAGDLERAAEASLKRLGLDHVDLLLIHWPNPAIPLAESIPALCTAKRRGLSRHIGVANFPVALLDEAVELANEKLVVNQCEYHPHLDQSAVLAACRRHDIAFTSYCPLGRGGLIDDAAIGDIARRLGRTASQIMLRWHVQQDGVVAIPRSRSPAHIQENGQVFDFALSEADMAALFAMRRPDARIAKPTWQPVWDA